MRELALWQIEPPEDQAFESVEPFCIDTMKPEQWLQWVFIPRLYALSSHGSVLPSDSFIAPYFEEVLSQSQPGRQVLLAQLQHVDNLLN